MNSKNSEELACEIREILFYHFAAFFSFCKNLRNGWRDWICLLLYIPDNTNAFLLGFYVPEDKPALKLTYEPGSYGFFHQLFTFWEKYRHCFTWKRQHYLKVRLHYHVLSISVLLRVSGWLVIRFYQFYMYVTKEFERRRWNWYTNVASTW